MLFLKHSIKKPQSGAALIEFAIIVPLLLLLVVGIIEFGFAFYHLNILNKSVQDAARYFSDPLQARKGVLSNAIDVSSGNPAVAKTQNLVIYGNIAVTGNPLMPDPNNYSFPNDCPKSWLCFIGVGNNHIKVTATYNHNLMTNDLLSNLMKLVSDGNSSVGPDIPLTASSVMRVEGG